MYFCLSCLLEAIVEITFVHICFDQRPFSLVCQEFQMELAHVRVPQSDHLRQGSKKG